MSAAAAASAPWGMDTSVHSLHHAAHSMTAASYYSHHPAFLSHHHPTAREFREAAGLQVCTCSYAYTVESGYSDTL